jgi:glycosyltransferase involved in cell wall biosynthesis
VTSPTSPTGPTGSPARRILVVSPYPPVRDGIGTFAVQQVQALRRAGHHVEVCSPEPSAAHHHLDLHGPRGAVALRRLMAGFDEVVIQFHPDFFYDHPATPSSRISTGLALAAAFRSGPSVVLRLHEVDRRWVAASEPSAFATRAVFRAASRVEVHSPDDLTMVTGEFKVPASRVVLVDHGADFVARTSVDRATARRSLGLPAEGHVFLCIGFVQPHKGFDRAAAAFRGLADTGASLHIVGSVRIDDPSAADHERELEALESQIPGVHLHLGYLSDEAFDRWIVAADTVVLPYRHIWSSGVVERARLLDRPVIATRVGSLEHQLAHDPGAALVDDNLQLAAALRAAVSGTTGTTGTAGARGDAATGDDDAPAGASGSPGSGSSGSRASSWTFEGPVDRDAVMAEVGRRSAANRGVISRAGATHRPGAGQPATAALPLRRLRPVPPPPATSARPGVSTVKKLIRRVIAWEVDPLREQLVRLQKASLQAAETTDARLEELADELDAELPETRPDARPETPVVSPDAGDR